jgi:hypothetical protein
MPQFRKRPIVVEARQVVDDPRIVGEIVHWIARNGGLPAEPFLPSTDHVLSIVTREGEMRAALGDWIIREPHPTDDRRFYPCKPDIFAATYEPVDTPTETGAEEILTGLAGAIRDYYGQLRLDLERTQLVEVLAEHGVEIDFEGRPRG